MVRAYLDHASSSPLRPAARAAMRDWLSSADPGRVHGEGAMARSVLEEARRQVADLLGTRPRQVVFTSGGTEAVNSATFGALWSHPPARVVMPATEHRAVRESSERWAALTEYVPVGRDGRVDPESLVSRLDAGPVALVHCQLANHEVGTLQPVAEVVAACRERRVLVHVDAAAAAGHVPIAFDDLGADLMSVSAHKLGGPAGIGALLIHRGLRLAPLLVGGDQERARRAGMENVAGAVGFGAAAAELAGQGCMEAESLRAAAQVAALQAAASSIDGVEIYGPREPRQRLPHLVCLGISEVEAEPVVVALDRAGVAVHSGSSCSSESLEPSPVLASMGVDPEHSLRLSVGWSTTDADIDHAASVLPGVVESLRRLRR